MNSAIRYKIDLNSTSRSRYVSEQNDKIPRCIAVKSETNTKYTIIQHCCAAAIHKTDYKIHELSNDGKYRDRLIE